MSFDQLGLSPELLRAVAGQGYVTPTPVQAAAIPLVLAGRDVLAGAQTGTGKTAAFVLPILQNLHARPVAAQPAGDRRPQQGGRSHPVDPVRVLVLVPTRELALQVEEAVRTYGSERPVRSVAIYGGVGYEPQYRALRRGVEIVVATPGRLLDHIEQRTVDLSRLEVLVLDEADRMLDMGFIRDIRRVVALIPSRRQTLLFSATFSNEIRQLAATMLHDAESVEVARRNVAAELVRQVVIKVDRERKRDLLTHLVGSGRIDQALVFTRTKHGANRLAKQLESDGITAAAIHGNRSQSQRVRALTDFKNGRVAILVATEVASRGLDIDALPHVVNYELPMVTEDYVHRIGRTGRAGSDGDAISLVCVDEAPLLRDIERLLGRSIETEVIAGFEPDPRNRPEPIRLRSAAHTRGGGSARPFQQPRQGGQGRGIPGQGNAPRPGANRAGRPGQPDGRPGQPAGRPAAYAQPAGRPAAYGQRGSNRSTAGRPGQPVGRPAANGYPGPNRSTAGRSAQPEGGPRTLPGERLSSVHGPRG